MFKLDVAAASDQVPKLRSLIQGDFFAPKLFNKALDVPASIFQKKCAKKGWGVRVDANINLAIMLFADNFWLFAKGPCELQLMYGLWVGPMKAH